MQQNSSTRKRYDHRSSNNLKIIAYHRIPMFLAHFTANRMWVSTLTGNPEKEVLKSEDQRHLASVKIVLRTPLVSIYACNQSTIEFASLAFVNRNFCRLPPVLYTVGNLWIPRAVGSRNAPRWKLASCMQPDHLHEGAEEAKMMPSFRGPIAKWTAGLMRPAPTPVSLFTTT